MFCFANLDHILFSREFGFCLFTNYEYICTWMHVHMYMKRKKEDFLENITWSEFGSQNIKHKKGEPAEKYKMATTKR